MTTPTPELCHYGGIDTKSAVGSNDDGSKYGLCNCGVRYCESGTDEEVAAAQEKHRGPAPAVDKERLFKQALTQALEAHGLPDVDDDGVRQLINLLRDVSERTKPDTVLDARRTETERGGQNV